MTEAEQVQAAWVWNAGNDANPEDEDEITSESDDCVHDEKDDADEDERDEEEIISLRVPHRLSMDGTTPIKM